MAILENSSVYIGGKKTDFSPAKRCFSDTSSVKEAITESDLGVLREQIRALTHADEETVVKTLVLQNPLTPDKRSRISDQAIRLVEQCRHLPKKQGIFDAFLQEYGLGNHEGLALMCLAEAMLRTPDNNKINQLIAEKIQAGEWTKHNGQSKNTSVNMATWGLIVSRFILSLAPVDKKPLPISILRRLIMYASSPFIRLGAQQAMKFMGQHYVLGSTIEKALQRGAREPGICYSFDMLGEGARTFADADVYFIAYRNAIRTIGKRISDGDVYSTDGISIKLSALHPRFEFSHREQVMAELLPKLTELALEAKSLNIGFTLDAEEAARLDLYLDVLQALALDKKLAGWQGLGAVVQAYQKRAPQVIEWIIQLAKLSQRKIMVRLVKGAYWDTEIKLAQEQGFGDYPVFTRKSHTDLCYQICAHKLLSHRPIIYPQFATHNAYTIELVRHMAGEDLGYEFQRLHGMGDLLYRQYNENNPGRVPLRIYAPVGEHEDLLPYLVRRLLENGANSSFVNSFLDDSVASSSLVGDVESLVNGLPGFRNTNIPLPKNIFNTVNQERKNSDGLDLDNLANIKKLEVETALVMQKNWCIGPIINGETKLGDGKPVISPANRNHILGSCASASEEDIKEAMDRASSAQQTWQSLGCEARAETLRRAANLFEARMLNLTSLISLEAGRTLVDGVAEVREAVDFCRYYAEEICRLSNEYNGAEELTQGRGVFVCISPWNFPFAIFIGQIVAALAAGNAVVAKPAEQTPIIAWEAVSILHEAGVPVEVLQLLTGSGRFLGPLLMQDPRVAGVAFTGSTETARRIQKDLAEHVQYMPPLIAETGGQNAMIVDSTALPEQVVDDVVQSAFLSAGQRCSALRVLYLQEDVADNIIDMLRGATEALNVGIPWKIDSDVGPVIDATASKDLHKHIDYMYKEAKFIGKASLNKNTLEGSYVLPHIFEINNINQLEREVFGPILHIIRYRSDQIDRVIEQINASGYGLTLGVHSRINRFAEKVFSQTRVGNTYINRNITGAVVGVNPFGGQGLSGTGFKAGGPHYLLRFTKLWPSPLVKGEASAFSPNNSHNANEALFNAAMTAQQAWDMTSGVYRANLIHQAVTHINEHIYAFSDKTLKLCDALITQADKQFTEVQTLPGPTGETNELSLHGRGTFLVDMDKKHFESSFAHLCAALLAGNAAIMALTDAKNIPEPKYKAISYLIRVLPQGLVHKIDSKAQRHALILHQQLAGVSVQDSNGIVPLLSMREGPIIPLVTEITNLFSLLPYAIEKTKTVNIVATGGNAKLLNLQESMPGQGKIIIN